LISIQNIQEAAESIQGKVLRTPLISSPSLSRMFGGEIYLKLENLQKTGSFKIRGATHSILRNRDKIASRGVVAASAGNHAQGVALAAKQAHVPATIVMPEWASISKQEATRGYGGEVVIAGQSLGESLKIAAEIAGQDKTFIHPFDDPDIIAGQGTVALEILEDLKDVDSILVPVGGGGLISGVAFAAKTLRPQVNIIGVQSAACPAAYESYQKGKITRVESEPSIADGINVKQVGELNFHIIRNFVDDMVLVGEDHIAAAILLLLERKKILAEGAGASSIMAAYKIRERLQGKNVVLQMSGCNASPEEIEKASKRQAFQTGEPK
jgi:threonine dehydratase